MRRHTENLSGLLKKKKKKKKPQAGVEKERGYILISDPVFYKSQNFVAHEVFFPYLMSIALSC